MEWDEFKNKRVFCKSKQGVYTGRFLMYDKPFLIILDKYDQKVLINESEVLKFVEEDIQNLNKENAKSELVTHVGNFSDRQH